jgi:hypothetical protein
MVIATVHTKRFIRCPSCNKHEFAVEHLFAPRLPGGFGPWSCDQEDCDAVISGRVFSDQTVEIDVTVRDKPRGLALLRFGHLYLVLEEKYGRVEADHADFFYHSYQCPTNLLHKVEEVFDPAHGRDPHGQLRYVAGIEDNKETRARMDACGTLAELLALFDTDGELAGTEWPQRDAGVLPMIAQWQREAAKKGDA